MLINSYKSFKKQTKTKILVIGTMQKLNKVDSKQNTYT